MFKKPSLIDRLTGIVGGDDEYEDFFEDGEPLAPLPTEPPARNSFEQPASRVGTSVIHPSSRSQQEGAIHTGSWQDELEHANEGELAVDVYQTPDYVVVKALVAGVIPTNLDISLSRDMITIEGTREDEREVDDDGYFQRELYWGGFSRTILLPGEVDVDLADATERHGILIIRLPKINKAKQTKVRVRTK